MTDSNEDSPTVDRGREEHRYYHGKYGGYEMPRGPLAIHDVGPEPVAALGFCPLCASNARGTTRVRGVYDCPTCTNVWYDRRVGTQPKSIDEFFSHG